MTKHGVITYTIATLREQANTRVYVRDGERTLSTYAHNGSGDTPVLIGYFIG